MSSNYYYHEIIKKTIVSFGTLFNNIYIKHEDQSGSDLNFIKVPIAYGPIQKFLARLEEKPDLRKRVAITLPRMSFEMTSIQYDNSRKVSTVQTFKTISESGNPIKVFMPVPYNIGIQLSIITKYNDDMLQIIEQILPIFQPQFNLTVDLVSSIGEKRDIPMVLENIGMEDNYEGDYTTRRNLIYTLNFTAKTFLFGPIADSTEGLIKKVQVDYYTSTNRNNASRELRYTATPKALKDYNSDNSSILIEDIDENSTLLEVSNSELLYNNAYISINDETMMVKTISNNNIIVERGKYDTKITPHFSGSEINIIDENDDELIPIDDDFGFNEERFDFGDGKIFSTSKGVDI